MKPNLEVSDQEVLEERKRIEKNCTRGNYYLNPDDTFTNSLIKSLLINRKRYGYEPCPCRLAKHDRQADLDIICPCYYRDDDIAEYGACFCGLYVSREVFKKKLPISSIPERKLNPKPGGRRIEMSQITIQHPIWRCNVCGYLCSRDTPPDVCPICGVTHDRFEIFIPVP
jgi:ferredoxin-thioredoxin reductase catalytic subunit